MSNEALEMNEEVMETEVNAAVEVEKPDELLPSFLEWVESGVSEDDIIVKLHEDHGLTYPAAVGKYRKLKSQAGLTSSRGNKSADVVNFIKEKHEEGMARKEIIEAMIATFGYTPKSAASTFSTQGKKLGITGEGGVGRQTVPLSDTVTFLRENYDLPKQELIAKMQEELGYAESTCNAFYIYIPMAIEWANQENAA
jgi:hypothetical protein